MTDQRKRPNPVLRRWEALTPLVQGAVAAPPLVVLLFFANLGPFGQPLWRSALYGIFEGGVLTGLLLVATRSERDRRRGGP